MLISSTTSRGCVLFGYGLYVSLFGCGLERRWPRYHKARGKRGVWAGFNSHWAGFLDLVPARGVLRCVSW